MNSQTNNKQQHRPPPDRHTWKSVLNKVFKELKVHFSKISLRVNLCQQCVTASEFALQMLWAAQTLELAVYHDGQPRTQRLTFLHTTERERDKILISRFLKLYLSLTVYSKPTLLFLDMFIC